MDDILCSWHAEEKPLLWFKANGEMVDNVNVHGPPHDLDANAQNGFLLVNYRPPETEKPEFDEAILMTEGKAEAHQTRCYHFWYWAKVRKKCCGCLNIEIDGIFAGIRQIRLSLV
jgi:hypothetical protein